MSAEDRERRRLERQKASEARRKETPAERKKRIGQEVDTWLSEIDEILSGSKAVD